MSFDTIRFSDWADSTPTSGSSKGVTSNGVYTALRAVTNEACTLDTTKVSGSITAYKCGGIGILQISLQIVSVTSNDAIASIPAGYRPSAGFDGAIMVRSSGAWTSTFAPCCIRTTSAGVVRLAGNSADIATGRYVVGTIVYPIGG